MSESSVDDGLDVTEPENYMRAARRVTELIEAGRGHEAVALADRCTGRDLMTLQLRGYAYTEASHGLRDRELAEKAIAMWQAVDADHPRLTYHEANAHFSLWELEAKERGRAPALVACRPHLYVARDLYASAAAAAADGDIAVQALVNLANSLDGMGRSVDALARYDEALLIDPDFGMALGNKGKTLLTVAPLMHDHQPSVLNEAAWLLDRALDDKERVLAVGGPVAYQHFGEARARLTGPDPKPPRPDELFEDPYLEFCRQHGLFLHASLRCVTETTEMLDPLYFNSITVGVSDDEQARMNYIIDSFNALKQDYLAARYLAWITTEPQSPISEQTSALRGRARLYDSLAYARWGVRTGMALQALAAAINMLDKVASFVHHYFGIERKQKVYFRTLWHPPVGKGKPEVMHEEIASRLEPNEKANPGLLALCDLTGDLERPTPLNELVERRHAATHRFLVAHHMLLTEPADNDWVERIEWGELVNGIISQLQTARAALIYLAQAMDYEEAQRHADMATKPGIIPTMPMWPVHTEQSEID
jgi:tetratricopeptide (TPR) repeat protein